MKQDMQGTLTLFFVTGIAIAMLLAFGVRALDTASQSQVSAAQCKYSQIILAANVAP